MLNDGVLTLTPLAVRRIREKPLPSSPSSTTTPLKVATPATAVVDREPDELQLSLASHVAAPTLTPTCVSVSETTVVESCANPPLPSNRCTTMGAKAHPATATTGYLTSDSATGAATVYVDVNVSSSLPFRNGTSSHSDVPTSAPSTASEAETKAVGGALQDSTLSDCTQQGVCTLVAPALAVDCRRREGVAEAEYGANVVTRR